MESFKLLQRRARHIVAAIGLVSLVAIAPFATAAQVTARSIELSSSTKAATAVTYKINFTVGTGGAAGAFVVDFCSNTPLVGEACTAPTGFDLSGATSSNTINDIASNTIVVTEAITASENVSVTLNDIVNPTDAGPLYARIVTYTDATDAAGYTDEDLDIVGAPIDEGSVAMSITNGIGVTGDVLETMTFCVSGADTVTAGCASGVTAPTLEIGEVSGSVRALSSSALSTAAVYTQISTNAVGGAVVSLKSNTTGCGGLSRLGAADFAAGCDIAAAGTSGTIASGDAKIGVKTATATSEGTGSGTFQPKGGSSYDGTNYRLNYVAGNATGITSTYGDPFLDTNSAPASNKEMALTFAASISPSTPAGRYTANYSLIATGTF